MPPTIPGLHHVTATVSDAHEDLAFYTRLLGLRLVKKTVNFDNHGVYHFYYGDEVGRPSTLMTTFPYAGQGVRVGTKGTGQITVTSFSVPKGSIGFWEDRFAERVVDFRYPEERFGEKALLVEDPSGLEIEIRESEGDPRPPWIAPDVTTEAAIRGVHGVTLLVRSAEKSIDFLTGLLGFEAVDRHGARTRLSAAGGGAGTLLEVVEAPEAPAGVNGLGTVHHVALAIADEAAQLDVREELLAAGHQVTPVRDRQYFRSIYFREPGGVLYEIATEGPGFTLDEPVESLGESLKLPAWEEKNRRAIEGKLPAV